MDETNQQMAQVHARLKDNLAGVLQAVAEGGDVLEPANLLKTSVNHARSTLQSIVAKLKKETRKSINLVKSEAAAEVGTRTKRIRALEREVEVLRGLLDGEKHRARLSLSAPKPATLAHLTRLLSEMDFSLAERGRMPVEDPTRRAVADAIWRVKMNHALIQFLQDRNLLNAFRTAVVRD